MAKNDTSNIEKLAFTSELEEALMEHPAFQWIVQHKKQIGMALGLFLLLSIFLYRLIASHEAKAEQDYIALEQYAATLSASESSPEKREAALMELTKLVAAYPELQSKYDGLIGEQLLLKKEVKEAAPYIDRTFARVDGALSPFYLDYAKTSVLLAENHQDEALKNAYLLKQKMQNATSSDASFGGVLYAFNLIRIALLEKQAGKEALAAQSWSELQKMKDPAAAIKIHPRDLDRVMTHFDKEGAKLNTFIAP